MLLSLHNINASIWGEERQIFLTYYLCVVGVVEVMKGMQALDVSPDVETLSNYILPVFPSIDAARQALKVIHKSVWGFLFVGLFGFFHVTSFHLCLFWFKVVWDFFFVVLVFRMQASLWSRRAFYAQRCAWWLWPTWPNSTLCVSTHSLIQSKESLQHFLHFACRLIGPALTHTHTHLPTCFSVLIRPFKRLVCVNM